jgi:hypothetical protein
LSKEKDIGSKGNIGADNCYVFSGKRFRKSRAGQFAKQPAYNITSGIDTT